jgi:hypothetical protein
MASSSVEILILPPFMNKCFSVSIPFLSAFIFNIPSPLVSPEINSDTEV